MKAREVITYIVFLIIIIVMAVLNKSEVLEVKERYEIVQEEKQYLLEENNKLENRVKELEQQESNNLDTRKKGAWYMEVKEMLENYNNYKADIKTKEYTIKKLELEEVSIGGSNFAVNGDIKPKGYMSSNTEGKIIKNADKIARLKKEIEELKAKVDMIDSLLDTLNSFNKRLLELRYKHNLSLESIAGDCGRSVKSIQRTLNNCIKKLNKNVE